MRASPPAQGLLLTGYASASVAGAGITVNITSDFPFDDAAPIRLRMRRSTQSGAWVDLRVPGWAVGATVQEVPCSNNAARWGEGATGEVASAVVALQNGTEHRVALGDGRVQVCALLDLPMSIRLETRLHGAVAVYRGPLLYSLPVQSKIRVPLFAARTLNATGQYRATLSLR